MDNYKFYRKDNYILLSNDSTKETFYGFVKEVLVDKSNLNKAHYRFFNIKDWNSDTPLLITQLLEEDGSPYTQIDFEEFYRQNTGNFNGGGSAPGVQSVTGVGVDNTDINNPVINIIPDNISDTQSIPFTTLVTNVDQHIMSGALVITPDTNGAIAGCGAMQKVVSNGIDVPDISAFNTLSTSDVYTNETGLVHLFIYIFDGENYNILITNNGKIVTDVNLVVNSWTNRLSLVGYDISAPRKTAYTQFIQTLVDNEIYSLITEMWMFEGGTEATNIIGFKGNKNLTKGGTLIHSVTGVTGDGSTGYLNTGYSPFDLNVKDMHVSIYCRKTTANLGYVFGSGDDVSAKYTYLAPRVGTSYTGIGGLEYLPTGTPDPSGKYVVSRNLGVLTYSRNGSISTYTGTDILDLNTNKIHLLANRVTASVNSYSDQEIGFASVGKSLSSSQITVFNTALTTLLTAIVR